MEGETTPTTNKAINKVINKVILQKYKKKKKEKVYKKHLNTAKSYYLKSYGYPNMSLVHDAQVMYPHISLLSKS